MRLAVISPTKYLQRFTLFSDNTYHMLLAQRVLNDKEYMKFYNSLSSKHFKILDNGACELERSISSEELLIATQIIQPNVLVLPDVLSDASKTLELTFSFLDKYYTRLENLGLEYMSVVQGSSEKDWLDCFNRMNKDCRISLIGISSVDGMYVNNEFPRVQAIKYLLNNSLLDVNKKIHILGLGDSGHMELNMLKHFSEIEGCDSGAPIVHGAKGIRIQKNYRYKKVHEYLTGNEILNKEQIAIIESNLKVFYDIINE